MRWSDSTITGNQKSTCTCTTVQMLIFLAYNCTNSSRVVHITRHSNLLSAIWTTSSSSSPLFRQSLVNDEFVTRCLHLLRSLAEYVAVLILSLRSAMSSLMLSIHLFGCLPTFQVLLYGNALPLVAVVFHRFSKHHQTKSVTSSSFCWLAVLPNVGLHV